MAFFSMVGILEIEGELRAYLERAPNNMAVIFGLAYLGLNDGFTKLEQKIDYINSNYYLAESAAIHLKRMTGPPF